MTTFSILRSAADRIARLALACDAGTGSTAHIGLRITPTAVRFAATNGRLLACLVVPVEDLVGEPGDLVIDSSQLTAALKGMAKVSGRIVLEIGPKEVRLTQGSTSAIARRIDGNFPQFDHIWTRTAGRRWIPTVSSLDPGLTSLAHKIIGTRQPPLFVSPVDPATRLERVWAVPGAQAGEAISLDSLRAAVTAPAYWADLEMAVLIMPITRSPDERQLDLGGFVCPMPLATAKAA